MFRAVEIRATPNPQGTYTLRSVEDGIPLSWE